MTTSSHESGPALRERVALYVAGALTDEERSSFETHLRAGCIECARLVAEDREVLSVLAAGAAAAPPAYLKARVLEKIGQGATLDDTPRLARDGVEFVRSESLSWTSAGGEHIRVKILRIDRALRRLVRVVRLGPGASVAPHRHAGEEESYVLDGELIVDGVRMRPGDYCCAAPGSTHGEVWSEEGCTFLASSSMDDELLSVSTPG